MIDLRCRYLGLELRSPLVASASPLAQTVEGVRRLAEGGVAAVVLPSLFEEQLRREAARFHELAEAGSESFAESLSYLPPSPVDQDAPVRYLSLVERGRRGGRRADHRQPERRHPGRVGAVRPLDPGRRGERDRAQRVPRARPAEHVRARRSRTAPSRSCSR